MKILTAYYTHKRGGFCTRLYRMMNALKNRGDQVTYLVLDQPPEGLLNPEIKIRIIPFCFKKREGLLFWGLFTLWLPIFIFWSALKERPQKLVVFGAYYSSAAFLASKLLGINLILFIRSLPFKIDKIDQKNALISFISNFYEKFGLRIANKIICMTNAQKNEIEEFLAKKLDDVAILPNDLPNVAIYSDVIKSNKIRLISSGVLTKRKNLDLVIEAVRAHPEVEFYIVGDGPEKTNLEKIAKKLPQVVFTGWLENPASALQSAHLYVHPALHEGIPNSMLEALALGMPVIGFDSPEMREILSPELLFKDIQELSTRISQFIDNKEPFTTYSNATKEKLSFDWDLEIRKLI